MVAEAKVNSTGNSTIAPIAVARSTGEVLVDAMTLAELQMQLAELDFYDAKRRLSGGVSLLTLGAAMGIATFPVLLGACGLALSEATNLSVAVSLFIVVGATLVLSIVILMLGRRKLRFQGILFERSKAEWRQNAKWLKAMLRQSGSLHGRRNRFESE